MNRVLPYVGSLGAGALVAGVLLRLFQPEREAIWASFLIAGLALLVFYLGARWREAMALLGRRGTRYGANFALLLALVAGIVGAINWIANRHNKRWDLTAAKQFTLSDQTVKILGNLNRDIQIIVFERKDRAQATSDLLDQYRYHSKRVSFEVVDPEAQPARVTKYKTSTDATLSLGTIVIDAGEKVERVMTASEQEVTNALIKVLKEAKKKIYFVEGHGEKSIDQSSGGGLSLVKSALEDSNYEVAKFHPLQSMKEGKIELPQDAAALILAGPERDYLPVEIDALRGYLKTGGKAVFLLDPDTQASTPNLLALVREWGVEVGDNVVIDASGVGQLFGFGPEVPLATSYGLHSITDKFGNLATVYPFVRSVAAAASSPGGVTVTNLLNSSEASWAETNLDELRTGRVRPDATDKRGPLSMGVALTITAEKATPAGGNGPSEAGETKEGDQAAEQEKKEEEKKPQGRAVVVGDSDFVVNTLLGAPVGNKDLFLNMVNWVAEDEDLIAIRPREAEDRRIDLNAQQQKNVAWLSLLVFPVVFIVAGVYVWWGRR
jgi:ABC-type uncharacterized transport system involved in gliding motility auxiliary subunit